MHDKDDVDEVLVDDFDDFVVKSMSFFRYLIILYHYISSIRDFRTSQSCGLWLSGSRGIYLPVCSDLYSLEKTMHLSHL
jgi:hypothetical protein